MTSPSFRDIELLSAYLDGQITRSEQTRLEKRLQSDQALAAALQDLHETRTLLRRTPWRRAPRNFLLKPGNTRVRPPIPSLVPAFTWASAVATLLFVFTLGASLVERAVQSPAAAPMLAAAPSGGRGGGPPVAATAAPALPAPAPLATSNPASATNEPTMPSSDMSGTQHLTTPNPQPTPTAEVAIMAAPVTSPPAEKNALQSSAPRQALQKPLSPWLLVLPGLAVLLGLSAVLIRWINNLIFRKKNPPE